MSASSAHRTTYTCFRMEGIGFRVWGSGLTRLLHNLHPPARTHSAHGSLMRSQASKLPAGSTGTHLDLERERDLRSLSRSRSLSRPRGSSRLPSRRLSRSSRSRSRSEGGGVRCSSLLSLSPPSREAEAESRDSLRLSFSAALPPGVDALNMACSSDVSWCLATLFPSLLSHAVATATPAPATCDPAVLPLTPSPLPSAAFSEPCDAGPAAAAASSLSGSSRTLVYLALGSLYRPKMPIATSKTCPATEPHDSNALRMRSPH